MQDVIQFITNFYEQLIVFGVLVCTAYLFIIFFIRKEFRIFRNLRKTIFLIRTGQNSLQREQELLKGNKLLYRVHGTIYDCTSKPDALELVKKRSIMVIGYSNTCVFCQQILETARRTESALIVLSEPYQISEDHGKLFSSYSYYEMCNSVARLLILIFNMAIIMPNKKK